MRILVTGFEPFGGSSINPSAVAATALAAAPPKRTKVRAVVLPVAGGTATERLLEAIDTAFGSDRPEAIVLLGESAMATAITVERLAANLRDYRIPDNRGLTVTDEPVVADGPAAYFATLPTRRLVQAIRAVGIPADLSMSAGTYLCNEVMYGLLHALAQRRRAIPAGFVHVPSLPEQVADGPKGRPSMGRETTVAGLKVLLGELVRWRREGLNQPDVAPAPANRSATERLPAATRGRTRRSRR